MESELEGHKQRVFGERRRDEGSMMRRRRNEMSMRVWKGGSGLNNSRGTQLFSRTGSV